MAILADVRVLIYEGNSGQEQLCSRKTSQGLFICNPVGTYGTNSSTVKEKTLEMVINSGRPYTILESFPEETLSSLVGNAKAFVGYSGDGDPVAAQKETLLTDKGEEYDCWTVASAANTFPTLEDLDHLYNIDLKTVTPLQEKDD